MSCFPTRWSCKVERGMDTGWGPSLWDLVPCGSGCLWSRDRDHYHQRESSLSKCEEQPSTSGLCLSIPSSRIFLLCTRSSLEPWPLCVCAHIMTCEYTYEHMLVAGGGTGSVLGSKKGFCFEWVCSPHIDTLTALCNGHVSSLLEILSSFQLIVCLGTCF